MKAAAVCEKEGDRGKAVVVGFAFVGSDGGEVSAQVLCGEDAAAAAGRIATARSTRTNDGDTVVELGRQLQAKLDELAPLAVDMTFQPGEKLGIVFSKGNGAVVDQVAPDLQAERAGVKVGWVAVGIDAMPFSRERLKNFCKDSIDFVISFISNPEAQYEPPAVLDAGTEKERLRILKTGGLYSRRAGEHAKKKEYALAVADLVRALLRPSLDPTAEDRLHAALVDQLNKAESHRAEMAKDGDLSELFEDLTLVDSSPENKDVDLKSLKRLYRDLSVKYHPDKNEASAKRFNRIRDAYEVLSDPMKTMLYDTGGIESVRKYEGGGGDLERTDNSERQMWVTLEEAYKGAMKKIAHSRRVVCRSCRLYPELPRCTKCRRCPGEKEMRVRWLNQQQYTHEEHEIPSKEKCMQVEEIIDINIERGMGVGERVNFPHMANQLPKQIAGDFQVSVWIKDHNMFKRVGNDLIVVVHVSLFEALLGFQRELTHLDGHVVKYGMDRGTVLKPGQALQIEGEGMPLREDATSFGKLIIQFKMVFPEAIPLQAADSLEACVMATGLITEEEAKKAKQSRNEL